MKAVSRIIKSVLTLLMLVVVMVVIHGIMDARVDYDVSTDGVNIPRYTAVDIPFDQNNDFSNAHPFAAGAIIDIDKPASCISVL